MQVLILEDEMPAAKRLKQLLAQYRPDWTICAVKDSVKAAVQWLREHPEPNLLFLDIQLADGLSFEVLAEVPVRSPIIFTTAFNQYTLKAFKLHSIDYLLKPIDPEELERALDKYDRFYQQNGERPALDVASLLQSLGQQDYKERFIVKTGQQLSYVRTDEVHYLFAEDGMVFLRLGDGKRHVLDYTMEQLEGLLDPKYFFRINRKLILHIQAIHKVSPYFNSRLFIELKPKSDFQAIVSRDRVQDFKQWMDR